MPRLSDVHSPSRRRLARRWAALRSSFGFLSAVAMLAALVVGFALPSIDDLLDVRLPLFAFGSTDGARSLLQTVATVTVSVAGLAFSVTLVAFTLTSQQLSPRVLRTFRRDRISQATLACFLATFVYCLIVLVRLGITETTGAPNLALTLAIVLALAAFILFALFIGHIVEMLQPSSVIEGIVRDARRALRRPFPCDLAEDSDDAEEAEARVRERTATAALVVRAEDEGFLSRIDGPTLLAALRERDGLVRQRVPVGDYVLPGDALAEVWCDDEDPEPLCGHVRQAFELDRQRSPEQDFAFPIRQLADVALKGLSPGVNDPTTAENAMNGLSALLVRFAHAPRADAIRVDADGTPRVVIHRQDLDDLVRLGFDQVRVFAAPYPVVSVRLLELLERVREAADRAGLAHGEVERQIALLAEGPEGEVPTEGDVKTVRAARARLSPAGDAG